MYVSRYSTEGSAPRLGLVDGDGTSVTAIDTDATSLDDALRAGESAVSLADAATGEELALESVTLHSPIDRPGNLIGVGLNYAGHAEEGGFDVPDEPIFFAKSPSSITGPNTDVVRHDGVTNLHWEGEFAFVVGKTARRVDATDALDAVFGYLAANDVTARDMQFADLDAANPWFRSKSMDTFTPLGPWVSPTEDGAIDPANADIETRVNGEVVQSSNTSDLIFHVEDVVEYISHHVTLHPGDVVLTGTPAGVGEMEPGDEVAVEIGGVGTLSNTVVSP